MSRSVHYSPALNRFLVKVLYHEARARGVRMTKLINDLVESSLIDSLSWRIAEEEALRDGERKGNYGS